jgi:hypothetical protein
MDLGLDSQNSLAVVQAVKKEFPEVKIIGMGLAPASRISWSSSRPGRRGSS